MNGLSLFSATPEEWSQPLWHLQHSVKSLKQLSELSQGEFVPTAEMLETEKLYPMQVTPFYLSLARQLTPEDPVMKQILPMPQELVEYPECSDDGLDEEGFSPVPRLVHRYRDRAVFLTCSGCVMRCRHCLRKRLWGQPLSAASEAEIGKCVEYLKANPQIRELLISGGDPLMLPDGQLERILMALSQVPTLKMLRVGTRTLVALPQRITENLCNIFEATGKTVWLATHFNHPNELSPEAASAVQRLMRHGVAVVNQSVLLKGINDDADVLAELFTNLLDIRIKPYYLFHGDPIRGAGCFRTGIKRGLEIMAELRGKISGMALPAFAFDLPEGGGKIRLEPDFQTATLEDGTPVFLKLNGKPVAYR